MKQFWIAVRIKFLVTRDNTYNASTDFGELLALSIAAADSETDDTDVAGHSTKKIGDSGGYLTQLLSLSCVHEDSDILREHTSENEKEDTWDL